MYFALLAAALLVGCLLAVQASVNLQLNKAVGTPYGASTLQLSVATALLAILAVAVGTIGAVSLVPDVEPWHLLGGLASPLYITSGILLFPRLGALAAVGLFVTGQMFASLALDLFGLFGVPRQPLTIGIAVGALAVLAGITVIIRGQLKAQKAAAPASAAPAPATPAGGGTAVATKSASGTSVKQAGWIVLGIVAGAVLPIQGAVNAKLRADLKAPITVAMISFVVATLAIAIVLLVMRALNRTPAPKLAPLKTMPWWGWLGGACAAAYVTATFMLIPEIGAATTVALTVTGQQLASALIDSRGLFQMPRRPFTAVRVTGLALLVVGSALVQLT
ncbi:DMT family transporter [Lentzea sp. NPDC042327]|uniref:DMT family transporter n=1 Tax=Lentzea sp. NPDC042327 TaxID=3154801 RepID=UPI00340B576B